MHSQNDQPVLVTKTLPEQGPSRFVLYTSSVGDVPSQVLAVDTIWLDSTEGGIIVSVRRNKEEVAKFSDRTPWMLLNRDLVDEIPRAEFLDQQRTDRLQEIKQSREFSDAVRALRGEGGDAEPAPSVEGGQYL